jgi:DNA-binding response OmpR family regulator
VATQSAPHLVSRPLVARPLKSRSTTILCIDDSADILAMLRTVLGSAGYQIVTCGDANTALEHFTLTSGELDLVVLDYDMPTANGVELARLFRRIDPTVPLLMFSGALLSDSETALLDGFVPKGAGCEMLLKAVNAGLAAPAE